MELPALRFAIEISPPIVLVALSRIKEPSPETLPVIVIEKPGSAFKDAPDSISRKAMVGLVSKIGNFVAPVGLVGMITACVDVGVPRVQFELLDQLEGLEPPPPELVHSLNSVK